MVDPRLDAEPDEAVIHAWLIDHYAHKVKLSQPRIKTLLDLRDKYPYLQPPKSASIYRGLSNVSPAAAGKLVGLSNPTLDKSWTTSVEQARKFADGSYIEPSDVDAGKVGAVLTASADPSVMLLDAEAIAAIPAVADFMHPLWGEPLRQSILDEREVIVSGPVEVTEVELRPMRRIDAKPDSMAVMLSLPPELAEQFPAGEHPHVTLVHLANVPAERADDAALLVADELWERHFDLGREGDDLWFNDLLDLWSVELHLAGLHYFNNDDERVAYAAVVVPPAVADGRARLAQRFIRAGFEVSRPNSWTPHATLGRMRTDQVYTGPVPSGSWKPRTLEVWRGDDVRWIIGPGSASGVDKIERLGDRWAAYRDAGRTRIGEFASEADARQGLADDNVARKLERNEWPTSNKADKLAQRDGKWVALSEDGTREFGTYNTEAEARERLRQVEAAKAAKADQWDAAECMHVADSCGVDLSDIEHRTDRSDEEKAEIRARWQKDGPNMGATRMREWLESPFAGPNRKSGDERDRARRVAERALRLMEKSTGEWTDPDYTGALQVLAFIERMSRVEQGEPLVVDGRKGPSARDASLRDWGFDPKQDGQQVLFDAAPDGSITIRVPAGVRVQLGGQDGVDRRVDTRILDALNLSHGQPPAPAVHTESRVHVEEIQRADKVEFSSTHAPIRHPHGWVLYPVLYSRAGNVQVYGNVREYRPAEEVFARASMDTGIGDPWELRHSSDLLNPRTVTGVARGAICTVDEYEDGLHTFGWAKAWDSDLILAVEGEPGRRPTAPEVSVAYRCKIDKRPGTTDTGERFDQRQFDIVWNSLASEPFGRAQTARVLTSRTDGITVHSATDLLALASGGRRPTKPVFFVPDNWARFDSASTHRPTIDDIHKDADPMSNKALIKAAQALGLTDEAISNAIGIAIADMPALMESETELTPDQVNALIGILPDKAKAPTQDMDPGDSDANMRMPEMAKVMIGEAEFEVPKAVAEHISALTMKVKEAEGRADRAGKRADKAESELSAAEVELSKRADAMKDMVTRADAMELAQTYGSDMAGAMELARRCRGVDFVPEPRKDAASGDALPVTLDDWRRAVIREAYGDLADGVLSRIDAAPNDAAREFVMGERMNDARSIIDARANKTKDNLAAIEAMRSRNASADSTQRSDTGEDPWAVARRQRLAQAESTFIGSNHVTTGA